jgi:DNA-directed RNA polymerase subunit H (RpoH/RPB5)
MSSQHNQIVQIYKSRQNILSILESIYEYDIGDYNGFTFNEIDAMYKNNQLDMLLTHKIVDNNQEKTNKTYIKYHMSATGQMATTINEAAIKNIVEDLYQESDTLTNADCLFIIMEGDPNDSMVNLLKFMYNNDGKFIIVYNIKRLQFNILEHSLVPKVTILTNDEVNDFKKKYNVTTVKDMPEISRFDPQAQAICLRPGQICKFIRNSPTTMETPYYRICV